MYDADAGKTLRFLRRAQGIGLTLREIKRLIEITRQGQKPCAHVRELIEQHLTQISVQIEDMKALRKELRALLQRAVDTRPSQKPCLPNHRDLKTSISMQLPVFGLRFGLLPVQGFGSIDNEVLQIT